MKNAKHKLWTKDFLSTCLSSFFIFMTFYILMATLPVFIMDNLKGSENQIGLAVTAFLVSAVLCRPITGKLVDDIGGKRILVFSLLLFAVSTVLYLAVNNTGVLLGLRFLHGIGFGMATTATGALVTDIIPDERRGEGMGYYSMFMSLAMVFGPFLGLSIIGGGNFAVLFILCSVFSVFSLLFAVLIKIPLKAEAVKSPGQKSMKLKDVIEPSAVSISVTAGMLAFAYGGILSFISVYAANLGLKEIASYFFVVYAAVIILSRPFTGRLFDRAGENIIIYPGIILFFVGLILLSQADSAFGLLLSGAVIGLGYGALVPSFQTIAIKNAPPHRRGSATATFFTFFDTGIGIGSTALGLIATSYGYQNMYVSSAIIVGLAAIVYRFFYDRRKHTKAAQLKKAG